MKQLILLVTTFCVLCFPGIAAEGKATPPNIIYIIADDLGYGDVRALNPSRGKIKTPNYDRLAAQGMVFTDAHSGSSVCTPTRYGVLTGRYAWRTRLQNGVLDGYVTPLIASNRLTVPALLKQNGYQTAANGVGADGGWEIEQLLRACNQPVSLATAQTVQLWLARESVSI